MAVFPFQSSSTAPTLHPLIDAVRTRDLAEVKFLIEKNYSDIEECDENGATALLWAAAHGYTDIILFLLESGANINTSDGLGKTPLMEAARLPHDAALKILLARAPLLCEGDMRGDTALHWAIYDGCDGNCLSLIEAGANIEASAFGENARPLHVAAAKGRVEIVKALIKAGARGDAVNQYGNTAGDIAVAKGFTHIDRLIREFPAQIAAAKEAERRRIEDSIATAAILKQDLPVGPPFRLKIQK